MLEGDTTKTAQASLDRHRVQHSFVDVLGVVEIVIPATILYLSKDRNMW